jgi:hypothetical protein
VVAFCIDLAAARGFSRGVVGQACSKTVASVPAITFGITLVAARFARRFEVGHANTTAVAGVRVVAIRVRLVTTRITRWHVFMDALTFQAKVLGTCNAIILARTPISHDVGLTGSFTVACIRMVTR